MSDKIKKHVWPNEIRLEMIEKSNFYHEPRIYQYGYYDGYQKCLKDSKEPEMLEMLEALNNAIDKFWNGDKSESQIKRINEIQIKSFKLIKEATTL